MVFCECESGWLAVFAPWAATIAPNDEAPIWSIFPIKNVQSPEIASENADFRHDFGLFWGNCSGPRGKYGQPTTLTLAKHHFTHPQSFLARFRAMKAPFGRFSMKNVPSPEIASENAHFGHDFGLFWGNSFRPRGKYDQATTLTLAKHHFTHPQPFLARFRAMKARIGRYLASKKCK